jgi:hypothetical protein
MGLLPARAVNALYARKATVVAPHARLTLLAKFGIVIGVLYAVAILMTWFGIPVLFASWIQGDAVLQLD